MTCPACKQDSILAPELVRLVLIVIPVVNRDDTGFSDRCTGEHDYFEWTCAWCSATTQRQASHQHLRLLLMAGVTPLSCAAVEVHPCQHDASCPEPTADAESLSGPSAAPARRGDGDALTEDDVLDFKLAASATPFLLRQRRVGSLFTADDQLAFYVGLSRCDYLAPVAEYCGVSGVVRRAP